MIFFYFFVLSWCQFWSDLVLGNTRRVPNINYSCEIGESPTMTSRDTAWICWIFQSLMFKFKYVSTVKSCQILLQSKGLAVSVILRCNLFDISCYYCNNGSSNFGINVLFWHLNFVANEEQQTNRVHKYMCTYFGVVNQRLFWWNQKNNNTFFKNHCNNKYKCYGFMVIHIYLMLKYWDIPMMYFL